MTAIYTEYFGLRESPFSLAPNPRYLYASEQHREALAHLVYGVGGEGGFVLLTGEVGTGKTTVFRCLLERLPENTKLAFILHPRLSVDELLATICDEFRIDYPRDRTTTKTFVDLINRYLLRVTEEGSHAVLVIDEAQNLGNDVLEQLRLLTNLETDNRKLLQIILLGQPELRAHLESPRMKQLAQRITARHHLGPLGRNDIAPYIEHRLAVAGARRKIFPATTIPAVYRLSGGVPRIINLICDRALLGAFARGKETVSRAIVKQAAVEVFGRKGGRASLGARIAPAAATLLALTLMLLALPATVDWTGESRRKRVQPVVPLHLPAGVGDPAGSSLPEAEEEMGTGGGGDHSTQIDKAQPNSLDWLFSMAGRSDKEKAEAILLGLWGGPARGENGRHNLCERAAVRNLGCLESSGGIGELRKIDRPALLTLRDIEGRRFFAVLSGLEEDRATLIFENGSGEVHLKWYGQYTLLWQPPEGYEREIQAGYRGPVVPWVRERLKKVQGIPLGPDQANLYDASLVEEVRHFQRSQGIRDDGIVGPLTLIHLNTASGERGPRLRFSGGG